VTERAEPAAGDGPAVRRGVRLALDVGTVRVGVARCDPHGLVATPVRTLSRDPAREGETPTEIAAIVGLVAEHEPIEVVVGFPRSLSGAEGSSARAVRAYADLVARAIAPVPVRLVDERLSTVTAHRALHAAGRPGRRHRGVVDQVAAVTILQHALDAERASSVPPGETIPSAGTRGHHETSQETESG
jgi:putative Holliday junction resolvase